MKPQKEMRGLHYMNYITRYAYFDSQMCLRYGALPWCGLVGGFKMYLKEVGYVCGKKVN